MRLEGNYRLTLY